MLGLKSFFPQLPITSQDYIRIGALNFSASPLIVMNALFEKPDEDNSVPTVPYYSKRSTHAKGIDYPHSAYKAVVTPPGYQRMLTRLHFIISSIIIKGQVLISFPFCPKGKAGQR